MKRLYSFLLAVSLFALCAVPAGASSSTDNAEGEVTLETVFLDGNEITVPVIIQDTSLTPYTAQSSNSSQTNMHTVTYYIPATEETLENNDELIRSIFSTRSRVILFFNKNKIKSKSEQ